MKLGLIGFGKAGKAVATLIIQNGEHSLEWVLKRSSHLENRSISEFLGLSTRNKAGQIYSSSSIEINEFLDKYPVDYIIDFSTETGIYYYGKAASQRGINIISAISHYSKKEMQLLNTLSKEIIVFWSPNITLGVNYLLFAAKSLKEIAPWVEIEVIEEHFKAKSGVSGTALKIAKVLNLEQSQVNSIRVGGIVGRHEIVFGFPFQTVRLIHESVSREAFGNGILYVIDNIKDKNKGFYNFEDILTKNIEPSS